jgi:anti-anti-sigma factor
MELQFKVECLSDLAIVSCSGRLVRGPALDMLRRRIEQLDSVRVLVLDFSEIDQLDAGGLGTLLTIQRWARRNSVQMKLANPSPFVRRILDATKLTSVFEISSLDEALRILRAAQCPAQFVEASAA